MVVLNRPQPTRRRFLMKKLKRDYFKAKLADNGEATIEGKAGVTDSVYNWHFLQDFPDPIVGIDEMIADLQDVRADVEEALREMEEARAATDDEGAAMVRQWRRDAAPAREIR